MPPSAPPDLSIVIVNYNTGRYLRYCLASIEANRPSRTYEVVVVDNGSSDGSLEMVAAEFPRTRVVATGENLGFAGGNNAGFRAATGEFVLVLNPDTIVLPRCLDLIVDHLRDHPDVGAVGPWIREREPDVLELGLDAADPAAAVARYAVTNDVDVREKWVNRFGRVRIPISVGRVLARPHTDVSTPVAVDWVLNCASLVRRADVQRDVLMDEGWFIGTEEIEFCCGWLRPRGFRFVVLPEAQIVHFGGRSYEGRADWSAQLHPLMHAAIFTRRADIFGPSWARLDSLVALADHAVLFLGLGLVDAVRPKPSRRDMIDIYRGLLGVDLRLLWRGRREADRINAGFHRWVPGASGERQ